MTLRIIFALMLFLPAPVQANGPLAHVVCASRAQMVDRLERQFRAAPEGLGLRDTDAVMELWTDPQGRWTLVQSYPDGQACIVAMGTDWATAGPPA
jgi:hypothetical protein